MRDAEAVFIGNFGFDCGRKLEEIQLISQTVDVDAHAVAETFDRLVLCRDDVGAVAEACEQQDRLRQIAGVGEFLQRLIQ